MSKGVINIDKPSKIALSSVQYNEALGFPIPFTQLEIYSGNNEYMGALDIDNARNIHILEFFAILLVHHVQVIAR